jgi:hypothetical protein
MIVCVEIVSVLWLCLVGVCRGFKFLGMPFRVIHELKYSREEESGERVRSIYTRQSCDFEMVCVAYRSTETTYYQSTEILAILV